MDLCINAVTEYNFYYTFKEEEAYKAFRCPGSMKVLMCLVFVTRISLRKICFFLGRVGIMTLTVEASLERSIYVMKGNEVSWVLRSQDPGLTPLCHIGPCRCSEAGNQVSHTWP